MRSVLFTAILYACCVFIPILWGIAFLTFLRPIKTARTAAQRALYILLAAFFPLIFPLLFLLISVSLLIQPALLVIMVVIVPVAGTILYFFYNVLPKFAAFLRRLTGKLARQIFSFVMNSPMVPFEQVDASIDTLASSSWKILVRNPINRVIRRRETDWVMGWWGRRDGRVTYLLALARDPSLENAKRSAAVAQLGVIASKDRSRQEAPGKKSQQQKERSLTQTSERLRELACDRAVSVLVRMYAAAALLNRRFRGEARQAFWDMAKDPNITDPLIRVDIAQGLSDLGQDARSQAVNILTAIMADHVMPYRTRFDAAKAVAPLCGNPDDARKIDPILKQWAKSLSPQVRLQAAMILTLLCQYHQNNPFNLVQTYQWDQRAVGLAANLVTLPNARLNSPYAMQAMRVLEDVGEIDRLISLGTNRNLSFQSRRETARALERLGQIDEADLIWLDLAQQTNPLVVTPPQRVEAATAAGQHGYWRETKEMLQSIAQSTCIDEPLTCLEAAAALRQLGWYEEAISFVMVLDKNHRGNPDVAREIAEAMRWRDL
jgi:hypothetical protein